MGSTIFSEDIAFYLRVLFTDQRGLNLRNDISHGLLPFDKCSMENADLVLHVFLIFAVHKTNHSDSSN